MKNEISYKRSIVTCLIGTLIFIGFMKFTLKATYSNLEIALTGILFFVVMLASQIVTLKLQAKKKANANKQVIKPKAKKRK
ncbi:hypothetical protein [Clostridium paridis]|uniref:Uncharacterized protein n=1 Tax=Clostridium paridis TaxID=2803863 RepID=A0A937K335_9CLOT|nr:hypothetical protein [Clostridium paridis]MBL4932006.1 hypothetical protein [Clostridium paridis]